MSSETKLVKYVNKRGERQTYPLSSAMESTNLEMVKRLKYTKDILTHMLNANVNTAKPNSGVGGMDSASNAGTQSQSSRPKTNTMTSGLGASEQQNSKGQLSTSNNKFSATDRLNMRPYQTTQNFNGKDFDPDSNP